VPDDASAFDPEIHDQIREVGGEELLHELFATFVALAPERLRALEGAMASGDLAGVAHAAHSIRSSSASVGARPLATLAGEVEEAAQQGRLERLAESSSELDAAYDAVVRLLSKRLGGGGAGSPGGARKL
jgi:HPt (histidine-containing phosphotransfer) domain-containing protein